MTDKFEFQIPYVPYGWTEEQVREIFKKEEQRYLEMFKNILSEHESKKKVPNFASDEEAEEAMKNRDLSSMVPFQGWLNSQQLKPMNHIKIRPLKDIRVEPFTDCHFVCLLDVSLQPNIYVGYFGYGREITVRVDGGIFSPQKLGVTPVGYFTKDDIHLPVETRELS